MTNRKLDAAIANVLGWKQGINVFYYPKYSTDGNAMLELIREAQNEGYNFFIQKINNQQYIASFLRGILSKVYRGYSNTMPEAVAKAFYKAKTGKEWEEMERQLRANEHKGGWKDCTQGQLDTEQPIEM